MNGSPQDLALWRHYEAALEAAASILALSRCRVTDREPLHALAKRQELQLVDLLHQFAYNARRAIEVANTHDSTTIAHAQAVSLAPYGVTEVQLEFMEDAQPLTDQSLWWVLGRIIHAQELRIHRFEEVEVGTAWAAAPRTTSYATPIAFAVRSDYDGPEQRHIVLVDQLLSAFLALRGRFVSAFQAVGVPVDSAALYV